MNAVIDNETGSRTNNFEKLSLTDGLSYHISNRLHVDLERLQKFRGHDVEADRELEFDQRARRELTLDRVEGRVRRPRQFDDLVCEGERRALDLVEASCLLPVLQRRVLLVGDADTLADALVGDDFV